MVSLDFLSLRSSEYPIAKSNTRLATLFERLFFVWITAFAAMTFWVALFLSVVQLISIAQLLYVYASITGITLLLAGLLYFARRAEE